ncbi:MAG: TRAP transporter small permease subunit [Burkholderiales bacterium]|nr:TRAP transporter small permease subunit [Burkholderiales bacterium]
MGDWLEALARFTSTVNRWFLRAAGAIALVILVTIACDLVLRNVFDAPTLWALDVSRFLLLFVFFLALAPALESGSHVSVDLLEHYLRGGPRRAMRIAARALVVVFAAILLWQVWRTTSDAFATGELFPIVINLKLKQVYWIAPVGVLQFLLTGLAMLGREWRDPARG